MQLHFKDGGVPQIQVLKRCSKEGSPRHTAAELRVYSLGWGSGSTWACVAFDALVDFCGTSLCIPCAWLLPQPEATNMHFGQARLQAQSTHIYIYTYTHIYLYLSISYVWTFYLFIVHSTYLFTVVPFLEAFSPT